MRVRAREGEAEGTEGTERTEGTEEYLLSDYEFLEDYEVMEDGRSSRSTFLAQIKNSAQKVRFVKKAFSGALFPRFRALAKLFRSGIVLADNMFVIEEGGQLFFYVIEAELEPANRRFRSLQLFLHEESPSEEERRAIVGKVKVLVDCLHQEGQPYGGLDARRIIVDDQNHIYLAPFRLEPELRTDDFSRAYYPPEVLRRLEGGRSEIDEAGMMRWDFWAFGCVAAEVLLYSSPLFLDTSLRSQIRRASQFAFRDELAALDAPLRNALLNSLTQDEAARSISASQASSPSEDGRMKRTAKGWRGSDKGSSEDPTELNSNSSAQTGDSELVLHLIALEALCFKEELHVTVQLNRKYHFYVDFLAESSRYRLNKAITIRGSFEEVARLLEAPVRVEAREGGSKTTFSLNLQSLAMVYEGRRLWDKQLLGTYKGDKESHFPQARLKVSCVLKSPQLFLQQPPAQQPQVPLKPQQMEPAMVEVPPALVEEARSAGAGKKKRGTSSKCEIPSISQISRSISSMTEHFIKKFSPPCEAATDSGLRQQIERVLVPP